MTVGQSRRKGGRKRIFLQVEEGTREPEGCPREESRRRDDDADVAQMVEHVHGKDGVRGSIPGHGSRKKR